ncbi:hypothetical protein VaNZ11_016529 [Volvox africanus]|uniref:VASt domain-containing protein n=1 Tax=Volvox africanus TaxID=51714 RepID=A0ABQ5SN26_9CHLO|nr:hypothetical protein VaNZ11_016529 [Volvox africanus]
MKDIEVTRIVNDCTAQLYFDAIYATDAAMRAFHAKVNGDSAAVLGPWSTDGVRTAQFVMPMNVPAMLKKFIGMDSVPVIETQKVEWLTPGKAFRLLSEPQLNFPGANKFTTSGHLEVRSLSDGTCKIKALVHCSASMPWPVQATVENLMATEATQSIATFLSFCMQYYSTWRAEQLHEPELPAAPPVTAAAGGEQFYDAVEDESEMRTGGAAEEGETSVVPYQPPRLEDIIVDCLRQIQASSVQTAQSLRNLEELIRNMDDNMQMVRDKLVGRKPQPTARPAAGRTSATAPPAVGGGGAGAANAPVAFCSSRGAGSSDLSLAVGVLGTVSLVCGAGVIVYVRYRLGAGGR